MANNENLKKGVNTQFSGEVAVREGSKGGKQKAENERKRKAFKEVFEAILSMDIKGSVGARLADDYAEYGIAAEHLTVNEAMAFAQAVRAVNGDSEAFRLIRDTIGEKPADKQVLTVEDMPDITLVKSKCTKKSK